MALLLNAYNLAHYLIGRNGVGSLPAIVDRVGPDSDQHIFFNADWPGRGKWFIKQPFYIGSNARFTLANEALASDIICQIATAADYVPRFIHYNPVHEILITERQVEFEGIDQNTSVLKPSILMAGNLLEETGKMMANLHLQLTKVVKSTTKQYQFYFFKPFLLIDSVAFLNPIFQNENLPSISREWLSDLFFNPEVSKTLRELSHSWKDDFIIHGDPTFSNILIRSDSPNQYTVKLCDWEFAGWGDPDWDIATFFQELLNKYMDMRINHNLLIQAGRRFYEAYTHVNPYVSGLLPFNSWFVKIIKLAAVCFLERQLGDSMHKIAVGEDSPLQKLLPSRDVIEFLLKRVLINPHVLKSF